MEEKYNSLTKRKKKLFAPIKSACSTTTNHEMS